MMKKAIFFMFIVVCANIYAGKLLVPDNFTSLQKAIDASANGDTILAQAGSYKENLVIENKSIIIESYFALNKRDEYIIATVIDGQNKSAVISIKGENSALTLSGFTIQNGKSEIGGGISAENAKLVLSNVFIQNNSAELKGGGIYAFGSDLFTKDVFVIDNSTFGIGGSGGGLYCDNCSSNIQKSEIKRNQSYMGGALYLKNSSLVINDVSIEENTVLNKGGGCYFINSKDAILTKVNIINNSVTNQNGIGGGLCFESSNSQIINCKINSNRAANGAAVYLSYCEIEFMNSIFLSNFAVKNGSVIYCDHSSPTLENITATLNKSVTGGVFYITRMSRVSVLNSILWKNSPNDNYRDFTSKYKVNYSDNDTKIEGAGNISLDPKFLDIADGKLTLMKSSPCRNSGNPEIKYNDPDGSRNDMGAYGSKKGNW